MKEIALSLIAIITFLQGYSQSTTKKPDSATYSESNYLITKSDAEKILGEPATLIANTVEQKRTVTIYRCTYRIVSNPDTNTTSNLYYLYEEYTNTAYAKKTYSDIVSGNRNASGQKEVSIGDEGYFHTDGKNFDLIIVRKQNKIIRMKVNKITKTTSMEELQNVAKQISLKL